MATDFGKADTVVTFDGLISASPFMGQLEAILKTLETALGVPVDIEFASDGKDFYLLQCRPQSHAVEDLPMEIPAAISDESILFTARRYVSNGQVADITHIVYVDPEKYGEIPELTELAAVGLAVGKLNQILPNRQFILIGPGRWGSRGDIKLGVRVTYSDINNSAMVIEVARKKGNYVPDVSFGTHFFQDLVESGIRYLPLYPDDPGVKFNESFLLSAPNRLPDLLPEFAALAGSLRVIDVPEATGGKVLRVLMNGDREMAVAMFTEPGAAIRAALEPEQAAKHRDDSGHAHWRLHMAAQIAAHCDAERWGVKAIYVFGEPKSGVVSTGSPIKLALRFQGSAQQRRELEAWLQGWSVSLAEMNYLRTGFRAEGLLDVHFLGGRDVKGIGQVAARVNAEPDTIQELPLGEKPAA
jgi:pyruvate,water dikinase